MQNKKWWTNLINEEGKPICCMCKKLFEEGEEEHPVDIGDWNYYQGACKNCYEKKKEIDKIESWEYHISLIGTEDLHCIKCCAKLSKDDITDGCESTVEFTCPQCKFEFTIRHGEPGDGDYYEDDYDEEKERERYYLGKYGEY